MTPWYQLTRLIWWPRSRLVAMAVFASAWGLVVAALASRSWYLPDPSASTSGSLFVMLCGLLNAGAIAWIVRRVRRRWAELEPLNDVERLTAIHAVYFGEDVGTEQLAEATLDAARWYRARAEDMLWRRRPGAWNWGLVEFLVSYAFIWSAFGLWRHDWVGFAVMVALGGIIAAATLWALGRRRMERARTNLWHAEWYAAQRLEHSDVE